MALERTSVLLSIQKALLGNVTPELRAVTVSWIEEVLHVIFYYHGKISEKNRALAEGAIGEIIIDFEGIQNKMAIKQLNSPQKIPCLEAFAYYRNEI